MGTKSQLTVALEIAFTNDPMATLRDLSNYLNQVAFYDPDVQGAQSDLFTATSKLDTAAELWGKEAPAVNNGQLYGHWPRQRR